MKYTLDIPDGWIDTPFPPPQRGLYLHAPPGGARGAALAMDAIAPRGTLAEQLDDAVGTGCSGAEVLARGEPVAFTTRGSLDGLACTVRVRVTHEGRQREETRVFALVDAGAVRLPLVFLGDVGAHEVYRAELALMLGGIRPQR